MASGRAEMQHKMRAALGLSRELEFEALQEKAVRARASLHLRHRGAGPTTCATLSRNPACFRNFEQSSPELVKLFAVSRGSSFRSLRLPLCTRSKGWSPFPQAAEPPDPFHRVGNPFALPGPVME